MTEHFCYNNPPMPQHNISTYYKYKQNTAQTQRQCILCLTSTQNSKTLKTHSTFFLTFNNISQFSHWCSVSCLLKWDTHKFQLYLCKFTFKWRWDENLCDI